MQLTFSFVIKSQIEVALLGAEQTGLVRGQNKLGKGVEFSWKHNKRKVKIHGMVWNLLQTFDCLFEKLESFCTKLTVEYIQLSLKKETDQSIAFALYAKSFAISFLFFNFFFLLVQFSVQIVKIFLGNVLRLVMKYVCNQNLAYSLITPKDISIESVPQVIIWDTCET